MQSRELRIGNYVTIKNDIWEDYANIPMVVIKVDSEKDDMFPDSTGAVSVSLTSGLEDFAQFDEFIEPIPLTEEWLIRFRFDFYKNTFWYKGFCYSIDVVNGVFILYHDKSSPFHGIETKYVHQLQNLYFALTGQELTFNK